MNDPVTNQGNNPTNRPTPTIAQPNYASNSIRFNRTYLFSIFGIIRAALIVFQFAGWVSAAAVPKIKNGQVNLPTESSTTRDAYLFFSIIGFIISLGLFILYSFNLNKMNPFNKWPIVIFILATDLLWIIPEFILAIVCGVRETSFRDPTFGYKDFVNIGAFASAAFFGFLCCFLYAIDAVIYITKSMKGELDALM